LANVKDKKGFSSFCIILFSFIAKNEERCADLAKKEEGGKIMKAILADLDENSESFDIIVKISERVIDSGNLLYLSSQLTESNSEAVTNKSMKNWLKILDGKIFRALSDQEIAVFVNFPWLNDQAISFLVSLFQKLNMTKLMQRHMSANGEEEETETTLLLLHIFAELTKYNDQIENQKNGFHKYMVENLLNSGLIKLIIDLLMASRELKPLTLKLNEKVDDSDIRNALFGFKALMVKILGNLSFRNRKVQDEIRILEGIPLILDHTNHDDTNPYVREWAVMAIRNICEDNLENQKVIQGLKVQGPASTPLMDEMGVALEISPDGKSVNVKTKDNQPEKQMEKVQEMEENPENKP